MDNNEKHWARADMIRWINRNAKISSYMECSWLARMLLDVELIENPAASSRKNYLKILRSRASERTEIYGKAVERYRPDNWRRGASDAVDAFRYAVPGVPPEVCLPKKGDRFICIGKSSDIIVTGDIIVLLHNQKPKPPGYPASKGSPGLPVDVMVERTGHMMLSMVSPKRWAPVQPSPRQNYDAANLLNSAKPHDCCFVDVGFMHTKMVCKVCDKEKA